MPRAIHIFRSPDRFVAGTVGEPGDRAFYLQAREGKRLVSVLLEKQQVNILADRIGTLLAEVHRRFGTEVPDADVAVDDMDPLQMPVDSEFRVGTMGLGWEADTGVVVVELLAVTETPLDESVVLDDAIDGPDAVRVFLSPEQARRFSARSALIVDSGRAPCPLCGEPLDAMGHICVRTNGYHRGIDLRTLVEPQEDD